MSKSTLIDVYTLIANVFNTTTLNVVTYIFAYLLISLVYRNKKPYNVVTARFSELCSDPCPPTILH